MSQFQVGTRRTARLLILVAIAVTITSTAFQFSATRGESSFPTQVKTCGKSVLEYVPSTLEQAWVQEIRHLRSDTHGWKEGCDKVRQDESKLVSALGDIDDLSRRSLFGIGQHTRSGLSYHVVKDECTGNTHKVFLEPLVSFLRHPLAVCTKRSVSVLDKSYMVVPKRDEVTSLSAKKWLFDAGASTYDAGKGGASQSWFVDTYRKRGIEFDRIIGWEARRTDPVEQWNSVPADIKRKTSWYNIPATTVGIRNPLTFIKTLTKPEDYVVFKLDIDAPYVEIQLVQQIMKDELLLSLIDEFYFEHHVTGSPMQFRGWGNVSAKAPGVAMGDITDSYHIFSTLRKNGVRAHSWV